MSTPNPAPGSPSHREDRHAPRALAYHLPAPGHDRPPRPPAPPGGGSAGATCPGRRSSPSTSRSGSASSARCSRPRPGATSGSPRRSCSPTAGRAAPPGSTPTRSPRRPSALLAWASICPRPLRVGQPGGGRLRDQGRLEPAGDADRLRRHGAPVRLGRGRGALALAGAGRGPRRSPSPPSCSGCAEGSSDLALLLSLLVVVAFLLGAPVFVAMGGIGMALFFMESGPRGDRRGPDRHLQPGRPRRRSPPSRSSPSPATSWPRVGPRPGSCAPTRGSSAGCRAAWR